jgi:hypothetical protein
MPLPTLRESGIYTPQPAAGTVNKGTGVFPAWQSLVSADFLPNAAATVMLAKTVIGTATNLVTFTSIPSQFTTLLVTYIARSDYASGSVVDVVFQVGTSNAVDGGTNYEFEFAVGAASSITFSEQLNIQYIDCGYIPAALGAAAPVSGSGIITLPGYSNTSFWKPIMVNGSNRYVNTSGGNDSIKVGGCWRNSAAINCVQFFCTGGNFVTGSTFEVLGVP